MDPNEALKQAREALQTWDNSLDRDEARDAAEQLARTFEALDQWLSRGGFLPNAWSDR